VLATTSFRCGHGRQQAGSYAPTAPALLRMNGVAFDEAVAIAPESSLPGWLQKR
jgi:hypothetical protein